jgi:DNA-binding phage protein
MTTITLNMTPKQAQARRKKELAAHAAAYAEACRETNAAFAAVIHRRNETQPLTKIAEGLDMSRVSLHRILREAAPPVAA